MPRILTLILLAAWANYGWADEDLSWIADLGGTYTRNESAAVTKVSLRNTWVTDGDLTRLTRLPELEVIDLAYTKITDLGLEELIPLSHVRILNLRYAEYVTDLGVAHLKHWKQLERLDLRGTKVTSSVFDHAAGLEQLRFLDVAHSRVNDDFFERLAQLDHLEEFSFGGNKMSGAALPLLKLMPALRKLDVSGEQRTDSGLWSIAVSDFNIDHIAALTGLEALNLEGTKISDRGLAKLASLKNLRELNLSRTRTTSRGMQVLTDLPLRHLKLWQAQGINDDAVSAFNQLGQLEILEVPETKMSLEGLQGLTNDSIKQLFIGGLPATDGELSELKAALPNCSISWWKAIKVEYAGN